MPLVAVSSVVREGVVGSPSGYLRVLDLEAGRSLYCGFPPEGIHGRDEPNPRGGTRGTKGISASGDRVAVAVAARVSMFDRSWRLLREVTHPSFGLLHGILAEPDGVWVTSTATDLLLKLSWEGECIDSWFWRSDAGLRRALGFGSLPGFDSSRDYRDPLATGGGYDLVHLNNVARGREGLLLSFGLVRGQRAVRRHRRERVLIRPLEAARVARPLLRWIRRRRLHSPPDHDPDGKPKPLHSSAVVELSGWAPDGGVDSGPERRRARVIHRRDGVGVPNHDVLEVGDLILFNDSNANQVVALNRDGSEATRIQLPGEPGFARGLARLQGRLVLAGNQSPAAIHTVDVGAGRVVASLPLSDGDKECVSSIAVLPDGVSAPPSRIAGFESVAPAEPAR